MSSQAFYWTLLALAAAWTFWRGGSPEKLGMGAWVAASLLTAAAVTLGLGSFNTVQFGVLVVDLLLLAAFVLLALCADRFWPLWVTGIHLLGIMVHLTKLFAMDLHPWAYAVAQAVGGYAIIAIFVLATWRHRRRLVRTGAERSWNSFSSRFRRLRQGAGLDS